MLASHCRLQAGWGCC